MLNSIAISTDAVSVPIVLLVLEGGPGTLETVHQAIQNNTPAVIVKVGRNKFCTYCTVGSGGWSRNPKNCSPSNTEQYANSNS